MFILKKKIRLFLIDRKRNGVLITVVSKA